MKTLIVEDELTNRLLLQGLLARHGVCHTVPNGAEALEAFEHAASQGDSYDLICMDIMMPGIDGNEVVRRIREIEADLGTRSRKAAKIVMTTGVTSTKEVFRSFNNLCDAYIVKPVDGNTLVKHLQRFGLLA